LVNGSRHRCRNNYGGSNSHGPGARRFSSRKRSSSVERCAASAQRSAAIEKAMASVALLRQATSSDPTDAQEVVFCSGSRRGTRSLLKSAARKIPLLPAAPGPNTRPDARDLITQGADCVKFCSAVRLVGHIPHYLSSS
jgi:hypothetical protein